MTRTHILNYLADRRGFKTYLEIGVQNVRNNFRRIICPFKIGVDPAVDDINVHMVTSDEFFKNNTRQFDLIFIDGLHEYDQVKKDFENALNCLSQGGVIMFHDTLPEEEKTTLVPRQTKVWHGDVYKYILELCGRNDIKLLTIDTDCGCTLAWRGQKVSKSVELTWASLQKNRHLFNIIAPHELQNHF